MVTSYFIHHKHNKLLLQWRCNGLPKIHKPGWPLRPIVSQIDSPTYKLSQRMSQTLQKLTGGTNSYVRDSAHFIQLLGDTRLAADEVMVSFDVTSLFTNVPVEETIKIIELRLTEAGLPTEYLNAIELCLRSGYFMWRGEYFLQTDGVAMGSPIAPVAANIFMEGFEESAMKSIPYFSRCWWRYVDDVFAVVGREKVDLLATHLNSLHPKVKFTVELEENGRLPFLDVLVVRAENGKLTHTVYRKPTHTDIYLKADSHHHPQHLSSVPRTLINRALRLCDSVFVEAELKHVRGVLESNGYGWRQSWRVASSTARIRPNNVERRPIYLPYIAGVTDKIGHLLRRKYDVKTIFRPPSKLRNWLRSPKDKEPLAGPGVYEIPCECGKSYVGETQRHVSTRLKEHIRSLKNRDYNASAITEHVLDSDHFIRFDKATVLAREKFFVPRKIREAIEISRRPNFNRDGGWLLPQAWNPVLQAVSTTTSRGIRADDVVSVVCASHQDQSQEQEQVTAPPSPRPVELSARARRAAARSAARDADVGA